MAEKKPLSVEEILAACRNADGTDGSAAAESSESAATSADETAAAAGSEATSKPVSSAAAKATAAAGPQSVSDILAAARAEKASGGGSASTAAPAPAATAAGVKKKPGEMSVAEMMAAARAEKDKKATAAKPAPKPSTAKSDAKQSPKAPVAAKATSQPMDTASILAAARKSTKAGPMSKAEAAKLHKDAPKKVSAPVMPEKPAYAVAKPATTDVTDRRNFFSVMFGSFLAVGFFCLGAVSTIWGLGLARFLFPNILTEPPSKFKVGFPSDFPPETVATKFKAQFGVWVVNTEYDGQQQITALKSVCTHLGCTPNWLDGEQKFKCPCHGSGFYIDGINFEGPAPRPLERYAIRIADDGQIEIDKSKKFQQEMGQWNSPACFVPV